MSALPDSGWMTTCFLLFIHSFICSYLHSKIVVGWLNLLQKRMTVWATGFFIHFRCKFSSHLLLSYLFLLLIHSFIHVFTPNCGWMIKICLKKRMIVWATNLVEIFIPSGSKPPNHVISFIHVFTPNGSWMTKICSKKRMIVWATCFVIHFWCKFSSHLVLRLVPDQSTWPTPIDGL